MLVPGKVPAIWEQFAFQDRHEYETKTDGKNDKDEGNESKCALEPRSVQPHHVNHDRDKNDHDFF